MDPTPSIHSYQHHPYKNHYMKQTLLYMFRRTQLNLQNLVDNDVFAQVISIESINNLGTHQLRQEGLLARRVNHLLLHGAVVWNPTHHSLS